MFLNIFSYMGIGLSTQGVSMNRLPGKELIDFFLLNVSPLWHSLYFLLLNYRTGLVDNICTIIFRMG